jgi:hypothetical protein
MEIYSVFKSPRLLSKNLKQDICIRKDRTSEDIVV